MTAVSVPRTQKSADKYAVRKANFFSQTVAENSQRVEDNVNTIERVKDEIKFIESILLAEHGPDV